MYSGTRNRSGIESEENGMYRCLSMLHFRQKTQGFVKHSHVKRSTFIVCCVVFRVLVEMLDVTVRTRYPAGGKTAPVPYISDLYGMVHHVDKTR